MALKDYAGAIVNGAATIGGWLGIGEKRQDKRQVEQQKKLTAIQEEANARAGEKQNELALKLWKDTNYSAKLEEANKAGVSKAAALGGSGAGTAASTVSGVSGGDAADAASAMNAQNSQRMTAVQTAMMMSQLKLTEAQTEKTKAEANKIEGVDTEESRGRISLQKFQNEVNNLTTAKDIADRYNNESEKIKTENERANAEWEAYQAVGYKGKLFNDPETPVAKALKAGFDKSLEELKQAKTETNIKRAEQVIEEYKANLAKQGISPDSPWYVKIIGDMMEKVGIPLTEGTKKINEIKKKI